MGEPHLLQSEAWGEFRSAWGTRVIHESGMQLTLHRVDGTPWSIAYAPRPRLDEARWELILPRLREEGCVTLRVEPDTGGDGFPDGLDVRPGRALLGRATFVVDLTPSPECILARMRKTTRYDVRLSERQGVQVVVGVDATPLEDFLALQRETARRQRFAVRPDAYYRLLFDVFRERGAIHLVNAYLRDECLSAMLLVRSGETLYYLYGGSAAGHREVMACYASMWAAIRLGRAIGCRRLDLWSALAPEEERPSHPWYGFHYFKQGFGGELVLYPPAVDVVLDEVPYRVVALAEHARRRLLAGMATVRAALSHKNAGGGTSPRQPAAGHGPAARSRRSA